MKNRAWCLLLALGGPSAWAQGPPEGWAAVDETRLETERGGFVDRNGLLTAFGIERLVEVNGLVVARQRLELADLSRADGGLAALTPLLVQNDANGQLIRSLTRIDMTVNALSTLKSLNLEGNLRQALANVSVPR